MSYVLFYSAEGPIKILDEQSSNGVWFCFQDVNCNVHVSIWFAVEAEDNFQTIGSLAS